MANSARITLPHEKLAEFCRKNYIRKLSLFGSVLTDDFGADSDIDFLVEFEIDHIPGLITLAGMEIELSTIVGRKADLRTPMELSPYFRDDVLTTAQIQYAEA